MKVTVEGIKLLHEFEMCKLTAYLCPAKVWTIGWGNTFYEDGTPVKKGDKIDQKRADELFVNILAQFEETTLKALKVVLNPNQFSALVSIIYNVGPGTKTKSGIIRLTNGKPSTLLNRINANPNDPTIGNAFMSWVSPGTTFEAGLRRRRKAEVDLYFS